MTVEKNFALAVGFVLAHEGGYVHDPKDPGGETKYGISKRAWPKLDIRALTKAQAREIYHRSYWLRVGADRLPTGLDLAAFDTAVNCGVSIARSFLSATNNVDTYLDLRQERYFRIVEGKPALRRFMKGWTNRVNDCRKVAAEMIAAESNKEV